MLAVHDELTFSLQLIRWNPSPTGALLPGSNHNIIISVLLCIRQFPQTSTMLRVFHALQLLGCINFVTVAEGDGRACNYRWNLTLWSVPMVSSSTKKDYSCLVQITLSNNINITHHQFNTGSHLGVSLSFASTNKYIPVRSFVIYVGDQSLTNNQTTVYYIKRLDKSP